MVGRNMSKITINVCDLDYILGQLEYYRDHAQDLVDETERCIGNVKELKGVNKK